MGYALTVLARRIPLGSKDGHIDGLFRQIKIAISSYLIWYFIYFGLLIIVINFSPKTEGILIQISLIIPIITILFITSFLFTSRLLSTFLSFIIGFLITALGIAYFSYTLMDNSSNIQSIQTKTSQAIIRN